jgi:ferrous iron transport protein B
VTTTPQSPQPKTLSLSVQTTNSSISPYPCIALIGNPNAGKTTLFNALTGLRAKTANFPGTTLECRIGRARLQDKPVDVLDLPGLYSIEDFAAEERVARDALLGAIPGVPKPSIAVLIVDATNLKRNLFLAGQVIDLGIPVAIALNMTDLAERDGINIDAQKLQATLGCPVVPIVARTGKGLDDLGSAILSLLGTPDTKPKDTGCGSCTGCKYTARYDWAEKIGADVATDPHQSAGRKTAAIDRFLTHPVIGLLAFLGVMVAVFAMIFWIASVPMDMIDWLFSTCGDYAGASIDYLAAFLSDGTFKSFVSGDLKSLLQDGIIGGVGGVLIFLPQICILFFFLSLLEDSGYLARAAFVMDRLMRRVGLPGKAFVPMISAHACAIPAVMATRSIDDKRDRLVTILTLPLLSCSARIPVYTMLVAMLFVDNPLGASLAFTGAYVLGILGVLVVAWALKKTALPGDTALLVLELPSYKTPSLKTAFLTMVDRASVFVKKAGTVILIASIVLWALATYPKSDAPAPALELQTQAQAVQAQADSLKASLAPGAPVKADQATLPDAAKLTPAPTDAQTTQLAQLTDKAQALNDQADLLIQQHTLRNSFAGRIGHFIEPAIKPLGYDWQIGIGLLSSLAAREVFVSTLAVVYGVGKEAPDGDEQVKAFNQSLQEKTRSDGSPVFTVATSLSLLVFYVFAMQCLSTLAVVRRETNSWKWPLFQFAYMTALAYFGALITYQVCVHFFPGT